MYLRFIQLSLLLCLVFVSSCSEKEKTQQGGQGQGQGVPVDVSNPIIKNITEWDEYTGRFEATKLVDIRARVTGYLNKKNFADGQLVQAGDLLFVIDPRPFEYQRSRAQARLNVTKKEYERAQSLLHQSALSQEDLDRRFQEYQFAKADLDQAQLDVEFTQVRSPIDGRVSDGFVDAGNLVEANQTILTRVVSIDPIHFVFEASQSDLLKYLRLGQAGKRSNSANFAHPVFIKLQDEKKFQHPGRMDFMDNVIDSGTGTIKGRALVPNSSGVIYPGLFGRARVPARTDLRAVLIPEKIVQTDQSKKFVYVVNEENKSGRVYIEVGSILDNGFLPVLSGLTGNERLIISGFQMIRKPNQLVLPTETPIEWKPIDTMPDLGSVPNLQEIKQGKSQLSSRGA